MREALSRSVVLWSLGPVFGAVAAWLAFASPAPKIPIVETPLILAEHIRWGPWRTPLKDASRAMVDGAPRACSECHKLFTEYSTEGRELLQHQEIKMEHGTNKRCLNCHFGDDRGKLILHDGTLVAFDQASLLCSQCHGTVYRDWQRGMHGKTTGSWDKASGQQHRLECNECHDPHSPAFKPMAPLPGPNTLRMGDQNERGTHVERHQPLRTWSKGGHSTSPADNHPDEHPPLEPPPHPQNQPKERRP